MLATRHGRLGCTGFYRSQVLDKKRENEAVHRKPPALTTTTNLK
jgi:hypothetical protein